MLPPSSFLGALSLIDAKGHPFIGYAIACDGKAYIVRSCGTIYPAELDLLVHLPLRYMPAAMRRMVRWARWVHNRFSE